MPAARFSQTLRGVRPRARMSSENDVSMAKFLSTRAETKLPAPCRRTNKPSATNPSSALRTVMRDTAKSAARSRSEGSASSGPRIRLSMALRSARCSSWYSGKLPRPSRGPTALASDVMGLIRASGMSSVIATIPNKYHF